MNNRVWVYLSDKKISGELKQGILSDCSAFVTEWNAHGTILDATFQIIHDHFLVFEVNESHHQASGCSIDKQVNFIKQLEKKYNLNLLNRLLAALKINNEVIVKPASEVKELLKNNLLSPDTITFDIAITTNEELKSNFEKPLSYTWLMPKKIMV